MVPIFEGDRRYKAADTLGCFNICGTENIIFSTSSFWILIPCNNETVTRERNREIAAWDFPDDRQGSTRLFHVSHHRKWNTSRRLAPISPALLAAAWSIRCTRSIGSWFSWIVNYPTLISKLVFYAKTNNRNRQWWTSGDLRRDRLFSIRGRWDYHLHEESYELI